MYHKDKLRHASNASKLFYSYFDDASAVIFIVDLCCYDEVRKKYCMSQLLSVSCYKIEYDGINRMHGSIENFHLLCQSQRFSSVQQIFLFLNKNDAFIDKITRSSLRLEYFSLYFLQNMIHHNRKSFPEYTGRDEYDEAAEYILSKFLQTNENQHTVKPSFLSNYLYFYSNLKKIHHFFTTAIDTENVRFVT